MQFLFYDEIERNNQPEKFKICVSHENLTNFLIERNKLQRSIVSARTQNNLTTKLLM